jgi:hypothetical protein
MQHKASPGKVCIRPYLKNKLKSKRTGAWLKWQREADFNCLCVARSQLTDMWDVGGPHTIESPNPE